MKTRADHLAWCKARAKAYLDAGDPGQAWGSFSADMLKHPETADHDALGLGVMLQFNGIGQTVNEMRDFIEGFN